MQYVHNLSGYIWDHRIKKKNKTCSESFHKALLKLTLDEKKAKIRDTKGERHGKGHY